MSNLEKSVAQFLSNRKIPADSTLLLACSGGVDSMTLLTIVHKLGFHPAVAHCNFGLRGNMSDRDEAFVRQRADELNLPFFSRKFDTKGYAKEQSLSIQMAARELRYSYFRELLRQKEFLAILLAHHADDSLETIFMNLGRGTGLLPLAGINADHHQLLRPFWKNPKKEIVQYARDHKVKWQEDLSNARDQYQRNFVRHHLLPPLKEAFPEFDQSFAKTLEFTRRDYILFESLLKEKLVSLLIREEDRECLPLKFLDENPGQEALLYHWLKSKGHFDLTALKKSIRRGESGKVFESENHLLLLDRNQLILSSKSKKHQTGISVARDIKELDEPLKMTIAQISATNFEPPPDRQTASLDMAKLRFPLHLRRWKRGDRFQPLGMKKFKKLSDFFVDEKLDRLAKEKIWLLCSGEDICWVVGHRIDDRYKLTDKTKMVYFARVKQ